MIPVSAIVARAALAAALGSIVGIERERHERAAGLRTHALVGLGAAAFTLVSALAFHGHGRIAAQIVTGIGFLGAGTIIFQREMVRGLTTAASIWVVAAIGMAAGAGMFALAAAATLLALAILAGLKPIENRWFRGRHLRTLRLLFDPRAISFIEIESAIEAGGCPLDQMVIEPGQAGGPDRLTLVFRAGGEKRLAPLLNQLRQLAGVRQISSENRREE